MSKKKDPNAAVKGVATIIKNIQSGKTGISTVDKQKKADAVMMAKLKRGSKAPRVRVKAETFDITPKKGGAFDVNKNTISMKNGGEAKIDEIGLSPAERRALSSKRRSDAKKKINKKSKPSTVTFAPIKGEADKDIARLEKQKKEKKDFEKTLRQKKQNQTSKFGMFDMGAPRLGVMTGRRAKRMPRGDITKKMKDGGEVMNTTRAMQLSPITGEPI